MLRFLGLGARNDSDASAASTSASQGDNSAWTEMKQRRSYARGTVESLQLLPWSRDLIRSTDEFTTTNSNLSGVAKLALLRRMLPQLQCQAFVYTSSKQVQEARRAFLQLWGTLLRLLREVRNPRQELYRATLCLMRRFEFSAALLDAAWLQAALLEFAALPLGRTLKLMAMQDDTDFHTANELLLSTLKHTLRLMHPKRLSALADFETFFCIEVLCCVALRVPALFGAVVSQLPLDGVDDGDGFDDDGDDSSGHVDLLYRPIDLSDHGATDGTTDSATDGVSTGVETVTVPTRVRHTFGRRDRRWHRHTRRCLARYLRALSRRQAALKRAFVSGHPALFGWTQYSRLTEFGALADMLSLRTGQLLRQTPQRRWALSLLGQLVNDAFALCGGDMQCSHVPLYDSLCHFVLQRLCACPARQISRELVFAAVALLQTNGELLPRFLDVLWHRTNLYDIASVDRALDVANNFCRVVCNGDASGSLTFAESTRRKHNGVASGADLESAVLRALLPALRVLLSSQHFQVLAKTLWFLYHNVNRFGGPNRHALVHELVLRRHFWRLFLHWAAPVRQMMCHVLVLRVNRANLPHLRISARQEDDASLRGTLNDTTDGVADGVADGADPGDHPSEDSSTVSDGVGSDQPPIDQVGARVKRQRLRNAELWFFGDSSQESEEARRISIAAESQSSMVQPLSASLFARVADVVDNVLDSFNLSAPSDSSSSAQNSDGTSFSKLSLRRRKHRLRRMRREALEALQPNDPNPKQCLLAKCRALYSRSGFLDEASDELAVDTVLVTRIRAFVRLLLELDARLQLGDTSVLANLGSVDAEGGALTERMLVYARAALKELDTCAASFARLQRCRPSMRTGQMLVPYLSFSIAAAEVEELGVFREDTLLQDTAQHDTDSVGSEREFSWWRRQQGRCFHKERREYGLSASLFSLVPQRLPPPKKRKPAKRKSLRSQRRSLQSKTATRTRQRRSNSVTEPSARTQQKPRSPTLRGEKPQSPPQQHSHLPFADQLESSGTDGQVALRENALLRDLRLI